MAIVKLGRKVKTNLPGTLAYVINPAKTDGGRFVYASYSGERQDAGKLAGPMILDLESCANGMREGSVLALHLKHSFAPDENVTPERVHEMGIALAEAITGGEYRYVVSTHLDRNHLHNHIVICTANGVRSATNCAAARDWPRSTILRSMRKPGESTCGGSWNGRRGRRARQCRPHHQKWSP